MWIKSVIIYFCLALSVFDLLPGKDLNLEDHPYLSSKIHKRMRPYLLPLNHPMHSVLDSIFLENRVTMNSQTFRQAEFRTLAKGPRSYIRVAKHPQMPGYLVKVYLDTELRKKHDKESWEWLIRRCEGARKIRHVIRTLHLRHFVVSDKWIYCLPAEPSPPNDDDHTRHLAILLVKDMHLHSEKHNLYAWSHLITKDHLDELFEIIRRAKGSSYRADNIVYTKNGKFAFIDTEYPSKGPDFKSIRKYLNHEMRDYWDHLVELRGASSD